MHAVLDVYCHFCAFKHVDMLVNYSWLNRCMCYLGLACHEQMKWDSPSLIKPCVDVRHEGSISTRGVLDTALYGTARTVRCFFVITGRRMICVQKPQAFQSKTKAHKDH